MSYQRVRRTAAAISLAVAPLAIISCEKSSVPSGGSGASALRGEVTIDGSSTVYPITEAVGEEFRTIAPDVRVTVGISGTGGGFKRFTAGETDISNASRPIKAKELEAAQSNRVQFIEVPVAYDGLTIVVHPSNTWVRTLTIDDLRKIFVDGMNTDTWNDVHPAWPNEPLKIFSPGTDSGTFDYFKEVVVRDGESVRSDISVSEDDNVLVRGVAGNTGGIGFFGCAYFFEHKDKLRAVPIVNPDTQTAVAPTSQAIEDGSYAPFSRPLFIYINEASLKRREVQAFVEFYLENAATFAAEVQYVRLPEELYNRARSNVTNRNTGTAYVNDQQKSVHGPLADVYN